MRALRDAAVYFGSRRRANAVSIGNVRRLPCWIGTGLWVVRSRTKRTNLWSGIVQIQTIGRVRFVGTESRGEAEGGCAVQAGNRLIAAHLGINMRVIVRQRRPEELEFPHADANFRHTAVIAKFCVAVSSHASPTQPGNGAGQSSGEASTRSRAGPGWQFPGRHGRS